MCANSSISEITEWIRIVTSTRPIMHGGIENGRIKTILHLFIVDKEWLELILVLYEELNLCNFRFMSRFSPTSS